MANLYSCRALSSLPASQSSCARLWCLSAARGSLNIDGSAAGGSAVGQWHPSCGSLLKPKLPGGNLIRKSAIATRLMAIRETFFANQGLGEMIMFVIVGNFQALKLC